MNAVKDFIISFLKNFGTNVLEAIVCLLIGIVVMRLATRLLKTLLGRTKVEGTAVSFIISIVKAALALIVFFVILRIFNIDTTGIVAIIAASGLAIGLALQDSISNIAGGVILLFTKPFKENDHISIGSVEGKIRKIKITTIEMLTFDNIMITIPNNKVVTSEIRNYSKRPTKRIALTVPVSHRCEIAEVKNTLYELINSDERVLDTPTPAVEVSAIKDNCVEYKVKFWVNSEDYWNIYNNFNERVLLAFKEKGIIVPFNKLFESDISGGKN